MENFERVEREGVTPLTKYKDFIRIYGRITDIRL